MAVSLRGFVQGATVPSGSSDWSWPSGTVVGDLAVAVCRDASRNGPVGSGWVQHGKWLWAKKLGSADVTAGEVTLKGRTVSLQVFASSVGVGNRSDRAGVRLSTAGAGLFVLGWSHGYRQPVDPAAGTYRLGDSFIDFYDDYSAFWFVGHTTTGWKSLPDADEGDNDYYAYEVLPTAGPEAPTLLSPTGGVQVDVAQDLELVFAHNSSSGGAAEKVSAAVRQTGTGTWYYVLADGTLTTTVTDLVQSETRVVVNGGVLTAGVTYEWTAWTTEDGTKSDPAPVGTFVPRAVPTVDSITVTCPAEDLSPSVAWTVTAGYGSQEWFRVAVLPDGLGVFDAGQAVYLSPLTAGAGTGVTVPPQGWTNGGDYRAWVQVGQTGGLPSVWTMDDAPFEVSYTAPDAPTSVVAANPAGGGPLTVTVTGIDGDAAGLAVYWRPDGDDEWVLLRTVTDPTSTVVVEVPLAPYGVDHEYAAYVWTEIDGIAIPSTMTASTSALASTDTGEYFVSDDGAEYLPISVGVPDGDRVALQGVAGRVPLGGRAAIVDRTPVAGYRSSTPLRVEDAAELAALVQWFEDHNAWYLRWGPERRGATLVDAAATRMALWAPLGWGRRVQTAITTRRLVFEWVSQ